MTAKILGTEKDPFSVNALENMLRSIYSTLIYHLKYVFIA